MTIPTVPNYTGEIALRSAPANFPQNAEDQYSYLASLSVGLNDTVEAMNTAVTDVNDNTATASQAKIDAEASATSAEASAISAAASAEEVEDVLLNSISSLQSAALAAGTTYDNITYSTNLVDEIKGYTFDATGQITYAVPLAAQGKFIQTVVGDLLTTTDSASYNLIDASSLNKKDADEGFVKIVPFGLDRTGALDSSAAINTAIQLAELSGAPCCIQLPSGTLLIEEKLLITSSNTSINGIRASSTKLKAASGLGYVIHQQAPGSGSYINRFLTGVDVTNLTIEGYDGEHETVGIYCNGVYNSSYQNLNWLHLKSCADLNGTIKCVFDTWHDSDREPSGTNKCTAIIRSVVEDPTTERDNTFSKIVMHARERHFDFNFGSDGINIIDNILFTQGSELLQCIRIYKGLYGTIANNKLFESRGNGMILDSCAHLTVTGNIIPNAGRSSQKAAISVLNTAQVEGYGQEITIVGNSINHPSGNGIEIYGTRAFTIADNTILWAGSQLYYTGQAWGSSSSIVVGSGSTGGTIADNNTSFKLYNDKTEYSRTSYDVLLEEGSFGNKVDGHLPYYVEDRGTDNIVKNKDGDTDRDRTVFDSQARNLLRSRASNMTAWNFGTTGVGGSAPTASFDLGAETPTGKGEGISTITFPSTSTSVSYVRGSVGTSGLGNMPVIELNDQFIFSVFMKSNSGAMRKITLTVEDATGAFSVAQVFNVGTTWKRYWMVADVDVLPLSQVYAYIEMQSTFNGVIDCFGAKVELIKNDSYNKRSMPSPFSRCRMNYVELPTTLNGGWVEAGDLFYNDEFDGTGSYMKVATVSGANSFTLADA